jgi:hypothetical protein
MVSGKDFYMEDGVRSGEFVVLDDYMLDMPLIYRHITTI